jgi:hypothetical protein
MVCNRFPTFKTGLRKLKVKDLLSAFLVTVAGGLAVLMIRRKLDGDPVSIDALIPSADEEAQGETVA